LPPSAKHDWVRRCSETHAVAKLINYSFVLRELGCDGWVGCEYRPLAGTSAGLGCRYR